MNKRPEKAPVRHEYWTDKAIAKRARLKAESRLPESKPLPRYLLPRGDSGVRVDDGRGPSGWQNAPVRVPLILLSRANTFEQKETRRSRYERMIKRRTPQPGEEQ